MAERKVAMPATTAGVTRYFEDFKTNVQIKPGHVIVLAILIMLITLMLHAFGSSFVLP